MLAHVAADPAAVVGGRVRNGRPDRPWSVASHVTLEVVIAAYNGRRDRAPFSPMCNLAMARRVFEAVGGFDERFAAAAAEDREFCDRCFAAGQPIVRADDAVVEHFHALDARRFWRQSAAYGRGEALYRAISAQRGRPVRPLKGRFLLTLARALLSAGPRHGPALALRVATGQIVFLATLAKGRRPGRR
jgi:GT2 family glycosyltransferase